MADWIRLGIEAVSAISVTYIALMFRAARAEWKAEVLAETDKRYVPLGTCIAKHDGITRELDRIEGGK